MITIRLNLIYFQNLFFGTLEIVVILQQPYYIEQVMMMKMFKIRSVTLIPLCLIGELEKDFIN